MMLKILILRLMPRSLRAFFWSFPGNKLVLTTSVEDFWNCALPSFLLYSVSYLRGLWKETLYPLLGKPLQYVLFQKQLKRNPSCLNDYCPIALTSLTTHGTHPFRPIPACVRALFCTMHMYSSWKTRFICPNPLHRLFFCLHCRSLLAMWCDCVIYTTTPHGKETFEIRR